MNERIADLGGDDETILFDAGDASGFFDGGRGETFANKRGDERGVLVPEAEAVGEDVEAAGDVESAELRREWRWGWPEGLVYLLLRWGLGVFERRGVEDGGDGGGFGGMAAVGGGRREGKEVIWGNGFEIESVCGDGEGEGEHGVYRVSGEWSCVFCDCLIFFYLFF